jgi:hypothetical protein
MNYIPLNELKLGVQYWVVNGHWSFIVKEILIDGLSIYIHFTRKVVFIPFKNYRLDVVLSSSSFS